MRTKRFLLVTAALSTMACGKDRAMTPDSKTDAGSFVPLPANPKGSFYDAGIETPPPPPPPPPPSSTATPPKDGGPIMHRLPANPKGSHYDAGRPPKSSVDF